MKHLSAHFTDSEFSCHCGCGAKDVAPKLVKVLELIRVHFGVPVHVTSGRRCTNWNAAVQGVKNSQHLKGKAADIRVDGVLPSVVADYVETILPRGGIGRYHTFTHVDVRGWKKRWDNR